MCCLANKKQKQRMSLV